MSTAPVLDERLHVEVFKDAVDAVFIASGSPARCYGYDEVPGTSQDDGPDKIPGKLPDRFALISLERRFVPPARQVGRAGRSSWRLSLRALGRTEDECRWVLLRLAEALDERRFTVGGFRTTALTHESSTQPRWDDKRYVAEKFWTYSL